MAINLSLGNVFAANLHNGTKWLGVMHGSYGLGGTVGMYRTTLYQTHSPMRTFRYFANQNFIAGPIIATTMVTKGDLLWSRYYLLAVSMSLFNLAFAAWSFWNYEAESAGSLLTPIERLTSNGNADANARTQLSQMKENLSNMIKAFKTKTVILGSLFIFAYQGAEVSISGVRVFTFRISRSFAPFKT